MDRPKYRERFQQMSKRLKPAKPPNATVRSEDEAITARDETRIGLPAVACVRPSLLGQDRGDGSSYQEEVLQALPAPPPSLTR